MHIQLLSDLHLEVHPQLHPRPAPDADLLVLAGDIGSYQKGSSLADSDFGLQRFSPRHGWPVPVLFVPGNHEYDSLDFDVTHARLREVCERLDIIWLERATHIVQRGAGSAPVRFVGTTLWSDFDALAVTASDTGLTSMLRARDKAMRAANFYLKKTGTVRAGQAWLAEGVRELALECQSWLQATLSTSFEGDTVAVTHFAPSLLSADPRYGLTPGTAGFCNALDPLLDHCSMWLHGHLHAPSNYLHRGCQVVANPLGYARKNEQVGFIEQLCLSVPTRATAR